METSIGEKITVCLLTYNHVSVIESTLASILDQTISGYDVVVSDDCSTDGTWERILEIAGKNARVTPLRTPQNVGMPGNANFAVAHSKRPYIALLHHDDLYRRDLLERWADILERYPDVSFVFNPYNDGDDEYTYGPQLRAECLDGHWFLEKRLFARWGCAVRGTAMIRRSWWDELGGMNEEFNLLADVDLWMRLAAVSQVGYVPEPLIQVRACRPDYYPDIYTGKWWHWNRIVLMYEIHASNRLNYLPLLTLRGKALWFAFRIKLSLETAKWLIYAIVRRKHYMIASSNESVTQYDLWPLRILRRVLQRAFCPNESSLSVQPGRH